MKYLVDTDWAINHLRKEEAFSQKLTELRPDGLALSVISQAEIYEGIYSSRNPELDEAEFRDFLDNGVSILSIDEGICRIFAQERMRLRRQGTRIDDMDLFIAATALRHGLILLSNNQRHFGVVEGLEFISLQR